MKKIFSTLLSAILVWGSVGPQTLWAAMKPVGPEHIWKFSPLRPAPINPVEFQQAFLELSAKGQSQFLPAYGDFIRENPQALKHPAWQGFKEAQGILAEFSKRAAGSKPSPEQAYQDIARLTLALFYPNAREQFTSDPAVPLETDADKLSLLGGIQGQYIPGLFSESMAYDHDVMQLLDDQVKLRPTIEQMESYRELARHAPPLLRVEVAAGQNQKIVETRIDPKALQEWRASFAETLKALPAGDVGTHLREALQKTLRFSVNDFLTGLINTLPEAKRLEIRNSEKGTAPGGRLPWILEFLERELPDDLVSQGFKAAAYGLEADRLEKKEALRMLEDQLAASRNVSEKEVVKLAALHMLLQDSNGHIKGTREELLERLERADEATLDLFVDPAVVIGQWNRLLLSCGIRASENMKTAVLKTIQRQVKAIKSTSVESAVEISGTLVLQEVTSLIGIFRGYAGADCSSHLSFPYPNSPMERVFFIYDGAGKLKGYAAGTLVEAAQGCALYLHTISGKEISAGDVHLILHGLHQALESLGAKKLVLPTPERLKKFINFSRIRNVLKSFLEGKDSLDLRYLDGEVRQALDAVVRKLVDAEILKTRDYEWRAVLDSVASYDTAKANSRGVEFVPKKLDGVSSQVQSILPQPYATKELSQGEVLRMALDLEYVGRDEQATRFMLAAGDASVYENTAMALQNSYGSPLDEYILARNKALGNDGLNMDVELFKQRYWNWFYGGWFQAPDALSAQWEDVSVGYLKEMPRQGRGWKYALKSIKGHIEKSKKLKNWAVSLFFERLKQTDRQKEQKEKFSDLVNARILRHMQKEITLAALSIELPMSRLNGLLALGPGALHQELIHSDKRVNEAVLAGLEDGSMTHPTMHFIGREKFSTPEIVSVLKKQLNEAKDLETGYWAAITLAQIGVREKGDEKRLLEIIQSRDGWEPSPSLSSAEDDPVMGVEAAKALKSLGLSKEKAFVFLKKRYPFEQGQFTRGIFARGPKEQSLALSLLLAVSNKDEDVLEKIRRFADEADGPARLDASLALIEENSRFEHEQETLTRFVRSMDSLGFGKSIKTPARLDAINRLEELAPKNPLAFKALEELSDNFSYTSTDDLILVLQSTLHQALANIRRKAP